MKPVHAIFEDGVFRPVEPVDLPEHCRVEFEPRIVDAETAAASLDDVHSVLRERFESGEVDVAARHNEPQP
jgi:predicted DNA-binding antitoxin AbrB/MazE fold protein